MEGLTDALAIEKAVTRHFTEMVGSCESDWHVSTREKFRTDYLWDLASFKYALSAAVGARNVSVYGNVQFN